MNDHGPDPEVEHAGGRLTGTVRRMLATAIALLQTRAELLSTEVQEEIRNTATILLWSCVAFFFGSLSVLMIAMTLVIAFWEDHRLLVASLVTLTFIVIAIGTALFARAKARAKPRFLESTLDELKRDRAAVERVQ